MLAALTDSDFSHCCLKLVRVNGDFVIERSNVLTFINAEGDLEPANPSGMWKGVEITVENHVDGGWRKHLKGSSPFTRFSVTDGITGRYGDGNRRQS